MDNQRPGPFFPSRASLKVLKDGWGHGKEATAFLVRVFGCDRCGTGQLRASKPELDIERLSRESDRHRSNLVHLSVKLQNVKTRRPLQNAKALIAKEMANQDIPDAG